MVDSILQQAFDIIAHMGWDGWVAHSSSDIHPKTLLFGRTTDWVWKQVLARIEVNLIPSNPWDNRDFILEVLLLKFDALQSFKPGLITLRSTLFQKGGYGRYFLEAEYQGHQRMIHHFYTPLSPNLIHQMRSHALFGLYLWAYETWLHDTTPDLETTTTLIDSQLQRGEQWLERYR